MRGWEGYLGTGQETLTRPGTDTDMATPETSLRVLGPQCAGRTWEDKEAPPSSKTLNLPLLSKY